VGKLNIRATDAPQGMIVNVGGEVTVEEVDELETQLQALASHPTPAFVLDLSELNFAASLAIGCLLRFRNTVTAAGGRVALADVQPMLSDAFRRAQLHRVFAIYPTVDAALHDNVVH
jgi:anti-sigma B factor antagonist